MRSTIDLQKRLADAGISRRYLRRLKSELDDHLADIEVEVRAESRTSAEASAEARTRLGSIDDLATAFLAQPELRSWRCRHPSAAHCIAVVEKCGAAIIAPLEAIRPKLRLAARYGTATALSLVLALGTLLAMQYLVASDAARIGREQTLPRRYYPVRRLITEESAARRALLDTASTARPNPGVRPEQPRVAALTPVMSGSPPALVDDTELDGLALAGADFRDYLPIVKAAPIYPARALSRGLEGYVVIEFTVARTGAVKDVIVVESSDPLFEKAAMTAAYKFKYYPRIVAGRPVEVEGVRNRITFDIRA